MKLARYLSKIDQFGVPLQMDIDSRKLHKTPIGGFISFVIYFLSFGYLIYILSLWQDGQILPKVMTNSQLINSINMTLEKDLMKITLQKFTNVNINPFKLTDNILIPMIITKNNKQFIFANNESEMIIKPDEMQLNIDKNTQKSSYITILFMECNQIYLPKGGNCANQTYKESFFSKELIQLIFSVEIKQNNQRIQKFEMIPKEYLFLIDQSQTIYSQIILKASNITIDNGFLFTNSVQQQDITNVNLVNQNLNLNVLQSILSSNIYLCFLISIDGIGEIVKISYPKFGEILASVASIYSLLMTIKYLMYFLNERSLDSKIVKKILNIYFKHKNNFQIQKNIFGKIIRVSKANVEYCPISFQKILNDQQKFREKLNFINLINELKSIQFTLMALIPKQILIKSNQVGIQLKVEEKKCLTKKFPEEKVKIYPHQTSEVQLEEDVYLFNSKFNRFLLNPVCQIKI